MSSHRRIKYFKQLAIVLTFFWTVLTSTFVGYQLYNEKQHILDSSKEKIKSVSAESAAFIYWAYEEKAKMLNSQQKYNIRNNFSLKDLLSTLAEASGTELDIKSCVEDQEKCTLPSDIKNAITTLQETKKDSYSTFINEKDGKSHLFYAKPLIANSGCISCHVHDDRKVGDLLGYVSIKMRIPTLQEYNSQGYYSLLIMYFFTWCLGVFTIWWIHLKGKNYLNEKARMYEESMYALIDMVEKRDRYTAGHSQRVAEYAKLLLQAMHYSVDDIDLIYKAGMLHDIGKIEIPDAILLKPEKLLPIEYSLIKRHSQASYELLCREPFSNLADIVLHHHERFDGTGYPSGLKGTKIPFFSQVIAVADAFDAMTTNRSYRKGLSKEAAMAILNEERGKQFNSYIIDFAQDVFRDVILPTDTTQMPRDLLEEMRFAYYFKDQLTGYYNLNYLKFIFAHLDDCKSKLLRIDHLNCLNFSAYNKKHGWKKGDELLCAIAKAIEETYPKAIIMRVYSDNFFILHLDYFTPMSCVKVYSILESNGLEVVCKHLDLETEEQITFDILEDKLLHLDN
ncbi:MAG: HD domain-containing protein [Sulfurospirillaceae bacterium]|nr:HD domain-containing protein [Sulfurospirillaceae bacterium]MDD2825751.1 HD domain-containing protein [Sulfurospirillaceae bacterium]